MGRLLLRVVAGFFALVLALSLMSFHPSDPHFFASSTVGMGIVPENLCGLVGAYLAGLMQTMVGVGAWLIPLYILWEIFRKERFWFRRVAWLVMGVSLWTFLGALEKRTFKNADGLSADAWRWGGWLGSALWPPLKAAMGPLGLPLLLGTLIFLSVFVIEPALTRALLAWLAKRGLATLPVVQALSTRGWRGLLDMAQRPFRAMKRTRHSHVPELDVHDAQELKHVERTNRMEKEQKEAFEKAERQANDFKRAKAQELALPPILSMRLDDVKMEAALSRMSTEDTRENSIILDVGAEDTVDSLALPTLNQERTPAGFSRPLPVAPLSDRFFSGRVENPTPTRDVDTLGGTRKNQEELRRHKPVEAGQDMAPAERLELPPRRLFDPPIQGSVVDPVLLRQTQELIGQKLSEFRVKGQVVGMQPGPVVTVFEFQPDPGVSLAKVMSMEDDLALGLQAEKVRIARIPGKNLVGIEVPNAKRDIIAFREIIDSPAFRDPSHREAQSLLSLALGKDIAGNPVVFDLGKMPHLLIGGSTGSGKSVGVNAMICSVLLRALPSEVKLILVDPKMVELGVYEDIPHLWAPVVTDMKEAGRVLKWVVAQMEERYRQLALLSVRNLESFNGKLHEMGGMLDLSDRTPNPRWPERPSILEPLPYVVVVIDELADLMMICRSEVEESIARIAQKARAVGIHLVLATQRPSVDIVTGVIKANLPARLSYRVNTKIDSRTILDSGGGEQLLGKGDALFLAPGNARPYRIHAPLLTEAETLRLVEWLRERGKPEYNRGLLLAMETEEETDDGQTDGGGSGDDIYDRAVGVVKRERKASTSLLQRKLNIGYGRAARMIDRMEEEGLVGPDRGAGKPREVYAMEEA